MRNQAFLLAACAAVVIGCGGGGGKHHSSSSSSGTPSAFGGMTVDLGDATYGRVEVAYLTGEGRAEGDVYLEISGQTIQNGVNLDVLPSTDLSSPIDLHLAQLDHQSVGIDVGFGPRFGHGNDSFLSSEIVFSPSAVLTEQADGTLSPASLPLPTTPSVPSNLAVPARLPARIRSFPGRYSLVQLRISDASFYVDPTLGTYVFDQATFKALNNSTTNTDPTANNLIPSRLSDYVRFPLAFLRNPGTGAIDPTERPDLHNGFGSSDIQTNGAYYAYFSGDNIALSSKDTTDPTTHTNMNIFQAVLPSYNDVVLGRWAPRSGQFQGTYDLRDLNPPVLGDPTVINDRPVAAYGQFRDYTEVLSGGTSFEMVMFPNSGEKYDSDQPGDLIAMSFDGNGHIAYMYFGSAQLDPEHGTGTFKLFPIYFLGANPATSDLHDGQSITSSERDGTFSTFIDANGSSTTTLSSIRRFKFAFGAGQSVTGGTATGTVTVFRK